MHDVDRFLPADLAHRPGVRRVRAVPQRLLGDDRGRIDEPGDHPDVGPADRRVVEDVVELRLAGEQVVEHRLARLAEVLGDPVQQLGVPDLVLDLGGQGELAAERRRSHQPLALGEDAHELGVRVHLDEAQDGGPILVGHRVGRFDLAAGHDVRLEPLEPGVVCLVVVTGRGGTGRAVGRREHGIERERIGHSVRSSPASIGLSATDVTDGRISREPREMPPSRLRGLDDRLARVLEVPTAMARDRCRIAHSAGSISWVSTDGEGEVDAYARVEILQRELQRGRLGRLVGCRDRAT